MNFIISSFFQFCFQQRKCLYAGKSKLIKFKFKNLSLKLI